MVEINYIYDKINDTLLFEKKAFEKEYVKTIYYNNADNMIPEDALEIHVTE